MLGGNNGEMSSEKERQNQVKLCRLFFKATGWFKENKKENNMIQGIIRDKGGRGTISEATIIILVRNGMVWIMVPVHECDKK